MALIDRSDIGIERTDIEMIFAFFRAKDIGDDSCFSGLDKSFGELDFIRIYPDTGSNSRSV